MTNEQLGSRLQESLVSVNNLLKYAKEHKIDVTMIIIRKHSTTEDIIENVQLKKISVQDEITFDTKNEESW